MKKNKNNFSLKNLFRSKIALIVIGVILLGGTGLALYQSRKPDSSKSSASDTAPTSGENKKKKASSSDDKVAVGNDQKDIVKTPENRNLSTSKKDVEPVITFAGVRNGNVEVRAYVAEVYEDSGKCTAKFTKGSEKLVQSVAGIKDATYTRCDRVVVPIDSFNSSGGWSVSVTYNSPSANGESSSQEVNGL